MDDKCIKVLHFLKTGEYSGAENVVITIIEEMKKHGVEGIYVSISGPIDNILRKRNIAHIIVRDNTVRSYQNVIDKCEPSIIHAHDFGTSCIITKCKSNAMKISHLHNNPLWIKKINLKSLVFLSAVNKYNSVLAVSESVFNEYVFNDRIKIKKRVIGNPVKIDEIIEKADAANCREDSDIVFLGRLSSPKDPKRFIKIIQSVKEHDLRVKALMIGKGELESECRKLINELGLSDSIELKGFQENPYGFLKDTRILCIPSAWEGFGLVVVEAFALGIPVVAAPVGGLKDLVTDESGKLCFKNEEFTDEIIKLLSDNDYYLAKSQAARERGQELDNLDSYINSIYSIYLGEEEENKCQKS